ncbi:uncharacterized protein LOC126811632 [Patella vulgata]|uniref:uncharacterized protein LOC126811632 n=1 Tax=Patella vulgata TaxID=6465 RepID=UPI00217F57F4|nr:uncharacterized protein LOC126811632 [Patella vulgata]
MYDLDDAENIPWEILDVLLCIQTPCYKHDHDHVCVIGNHVYTIPLWKIPNTTYLSDTSSPSIDIGWESSSEDHDDDTEENSNEEYGYDYKDTDDDDKDSDGDDKDSDGYDKESDDEIDEDGDGLGFYQSKVSPKIYDYKTFVPIDPAIPDGLHFNEPDNIKLKAPIIDITEAIGSESCDIGEHGDILVEKPEPQTVKEIIFTKTVEVKENVKNVIENVYETGKILVENIYPSIPYSAPETTDDQKTASPKLIINSVLNEDDIGQPCANSSFKTELNNEYRTNLVTKQCFTSDENDLSWVEDDSTYLEEIMNLQNEIISPRSRPGFNEVDFNLSQHLHDLSMRLSKDSHDIHDLNKTLSFYGELSPFELGASWLVRSLLNHVIDQLNISARADSLLEDISDRFTSILNNSR